MDASQNPAFPLTRFLLPQAWRVLWTRCPCLRILAHLGIDIIRLTGQIVVSCTAQQMQSRDNLLECRLLAIWLCESSEGA